MKGLIVHPIRELLGNLGNPMGTFKSHTNALIQPFKFHYIPRLVITRGLELMASILSERIPQSASSPPQSLFNEGLSLYISSKLCEKMEVETSSNVKYYASVL